MKVDSVGWAFFGLAVLVVSGYVLNRGIYIGSETSKGILRLNNGTTIPVYRKSCNYLHFSGIREDEGMAEDHEYDAEKRFCRMFFS